MRYPLSTWILVGACAMAVMISIPGRAQVGNSAGAERAGFTCCNFHYDGDRISDANWGIYPRIAPGTPARVLAYGEHFVSVEIAGRAMRLDLDYGRQQDLREWAQRMIVAQDPKPKIAGWPQGVQEAVAAGRIALGMSKEQVIAAVGYPPAHATPTLDAPQWTFWYDTHGTYTVVWDPAARVVEVDTTPPIRYRVMLHGEATPLLSVTSDPVRMNDLEGLLPRANGAVR